MYPHSQNKSKFFIIQAKIYPELKQNEVLLKYNKYNHKDFEKVISGKSYDQDYNNVFTHSYKISDSKYLEKISLNKYVEEMSVKTKDPSYDNTNTYINNFF